MKKINMLEASTVVGGTKACVNSFELNMVGDDKFCNAAKTCTDKNGVISKSYTPVAIINCGVVG